MDEPTSALSNDEVQVLFKLIRELLAEGVTIIYISHKLEELMQIGDYITVLRDGNKIAEAKISDIDLPWIIRQMVGSEKNQYLHVFSFHNNIVVLFYFCSDFILITVSFG